eukprot:bmy_15039T0
MISPTHIKTNNKQPQSQGAGLIINTNVTHSIYWFNQPSRATTPLIYTSHAALNKCRNSSSPMSRLCDYRFSNYQDYQPIYPTSITSRAINSQYYSRKLVDSSNRRGNSSINKYQHCYSFYYIHRSYPTYYPRICHCYNSSLCVYPPTSTYMTIHNDPPDPCIPHSKPQSLTSYRSPFSLLNDIGSNHVIPLQLDNIINIRPTN